MKMSQSTYKHIEAAINGLESYCGESDKFKKLRETVPYKKNQFTAFVFQVYYAAINYYKRLHNIDLHALVNNEGLSDKHIETALKKILKSYE